jgi:hypothetical protein
MANRYPLVANASTLTIQELPSNDTLLVDNLTSTGNLSVSGNSNLGAISTVIITGGSNGQFITTDGAGNLRFTTGTMNLGDNNFDFGIIGQITVNTIFEWLLNSIDVDNGTIISPVNLDYDAGTLI